MGGGGGVGGGVVYRVAIQALKGNQSGSLAQQPPKRTTMCGYPYLGSFCVLASKGR